jgi:hypothetical protein
MLGLCKYIVNVHLTHSLPLEDTKYNSCEKQPGRLLVLSLFYSDASPKDL